MSQMGGPTPPPRGRGIFGIMGDSINVEGHRIPVSVLALIATVVGVILVLRARSSGSSVIAAGTPASSASPSSTYDPYAAEAAALNQQQTQLGNLLSTLSSNYGIAGTPAAASTATNPYTDLSNELMSGGGYYQPGGVSAGGISGSTAPISTPQGTFAWVTSWPTIQELLAAGQQVFVQALPGQFVPFSGNPAQYPTGTPLYSLVGPSYPSSGVSPLPSSSPSAAGPSYPPGGPLPAQPTSYQPSPRVVGQVPAGPQLGSAVAA